MAFDTIFDILKGAFDGVSALRVSISSSGAGLATSTNQTSQITQETAIATSTAALVTATGTDGAAAPAKTTQVGGFDGTNLQALNVDVLGNLLPDLYFTGAATQTATVNNIIPAASGATASDGLSYKSASVQVVSTGTAGTFIFEGCNDNVNFQALPVYNQVVLTGTPIIAAITASVSQVVYVFPLNVRYVRLRIATLITGGSLQAFSKLSQAPYAPAVVQVAQATAANANMTASQGGTWNVGLTTPTSTTDIASGAIITTTTTAAITPTQAFSHQFEIGVTAASGTNPTLDVKIQESPDSGVNWSDVYQFPRITAAFSFRTPFMRITGNRVRYVQTVGGATPSFTRSVIRNSAPVACSTFRVFRDRTIDPTVTGSATPSWSAEGISQVSIYVNTGGTNVTPSQFAVQNSPDGFSAWATCSTTLSVNSGANGFLGNINGPFNFIRVVIPTGVALSTCNEACIVGIGA